MGSLRTILYTLLRLGGSSKPHFEVLMFLSEHKVKNIACLPLSKLVDTSKTSFFVFPPQGVTLIYFSSYTF